MSDNVKNMTSGHPGKLIFLFAVPLMLGNVFQQLYTVVDTMVVGQVVGVKALAAVGAADWLIWMVQTVISGSAQGFSILTAQNYGAGKKQELKKTVAASYVLMIALTVVVFCISQIFLRPALVFLNTPADILDLSLLYCRIVFCGVPVVAAYNTFASILRALGNGRSPLIAMVMASVINVALDLLFVMGFDWGVAGAAVATMIAQCFSALYCLWILRKIDTVKVNREDFTGVRELFRELMGLGVPVAFQNLIISVGGLVVQSAVNGYGFLFVAGFTATNKIYGVLELAAISYGYAITTYVGQNLGAGNIPRIKKGVKNGGIMAVVTALGVGAVMIVGGKSILSLFISGNPQEAEQVLEIAYHYLFVMAVFLPVLYLLYVFRSAIQGLGNTVIPMASGIVEFFMRVGAVMILPLFIGENGIFYAEISAWAGAALLLAVSYFRVIRGRSFSRKKILRIFLGIFFLFAAAGGILYGMILREAPKVEEIHIGPTEYATFVYDDEGNEIQQLNDAQSNRIRVSMEDIPEDMQHAMVAIEDSRFYEHHGIDYRGMLRAAAVTVTSGFQQREGASTITQQLIKNNVFAGWTEENFWQSVKRKLQEQYLAVKLERYLEEQGMDPKAVILEEYLNTVNFGSGAYGVEMAARTYFGKSSRELTLAECAVLAAIPQNPTRWNPRENPEGNAARRDTVLAYMEEQGWITDQEKKEALEEDVYAGILDEDESRKQGTAYSYFVDELISQVQEDLVEKKGYTQTQAANAVYSGGLRIYSTQDSQIQEVLEEEFQNPENYPGNMQYSLDWAFTVKRQDGSQENFGQETLRNYFGEQGEEVPRLFQSREEGLAYLERYKQALLQEGDEILGERLEWIPQPQAAMTVVEQSTGYVRGIAGGLGEKTASLTLNRATDIYRQPGSAFKILAAYGPALEAREVTLAERIEDEAYAYEDGTPVRNSDGSYHGSVSVREAIVNSYNIPAVKVLTEITPETGFEYLQDLGFSRLDPRQDVIQPLALGGITNGVSSLELTAAYGALANGGIYREPIFYTKVTDQDGNVILENSPKGRRVFEESTAFLLTSAMEDVVSEGTGTGFQLENMTVAGKTGTANDYRDLTFAGYTPYYTAAIWAGYDESRELSQEYRTFHRTLWRTVMERIHENLPEKEFEQPDNVREIAICEETGLLAGSGCTKVKEYFEESTVPERTCRVHRFTLFPEKNEKEEKEEEEKSSWWEKFWSWLE